MGARNPRGATGCSSATSCRRLVGRALPARVPAMCARRAQCPPAARPQWRRDPLRVPPAGLHVPLAERLARSQSYAAARGGTGAGAAGGGVARSRNRAAAASRDQHQVRSSHLWHHTAYPSEVSRPPAHPRPRLASGRAGAVWMLSLNRRRRAGIDVVQLAARRVRPALALCSRLVPLPAPRRPPVHRRGVGARAAHSPGELPLCVCCKAGRCVPKHVQGCKHAASL